MKELLFEAVSQAKNKNLYFASQKESRSRNMRVQSIAFDTYTKLGELLVFLAYRGCSLFYIQ